MKNIKELEKGIKDGRKKVFNREIEIMSPEFHEIAYNEVILKQTKEICKIIKDLKYNSNDLLEYKKRLLNKIKGKNKK